MSHDFKMAIQNKQLWSFVFLVFLTISVRHRGCHGVSFTSPKSYTINLDDPPELRWEAVAKDHSDIIKYIRQILQTYVPDEVVPLLEKIASGMDEYFTEPFASEMRGMAKALNVPVGEIVIPNIIYDLTAHCTSIVAQDSNGRIWHGRNLDYKFTDILRNITIEVNFQKGGTTVYSGVTYAGYVGILTGQRPNAFTITADERNHGDPWWYNALVAILDKKAMLMTFLLRETLAKVPSFHQAVANLANTATPSTVYYIIGGVAPGQGAVITKDRLEAQDIWYLDAQTGRWFLVETNYDHWQPPPHDDDRRDIAIRAMNVTGQAKINKQTMFNVLSTPKVLSSHTTYTTVMCAGDPSIFQTWIRHV